MFEQAFKTIDDTLRTDAGLSTEMDYIEQTSWILFLKYLADREHEKKIKDDLQEKDRHDIILANPPFGASEDAGVKNNFPIKTSETANMFMQHFVKKLKTDGRVAIVIKNTFLSK